jgi:prophage regulatory protein
MTQNRAARPQFAIHELIDILAEDIKARVVNAVTRELVKQQSAPAARQSVQQRGDEPAPRSCGEVTERTGLQKNTIYDYIRRGTFPAQIKLGSSVFWLENDIDAWMEKHIPTGH